MKRIFKSRVFFFVLGLIIAGSIGAYAAAQIYANQIGYDNSNSDLESTNVQGAIDELYLKVNENTASQYVNLGAYDVNSEPEITLKEGELIGFSGGNGGRTMQYYLNGVLTYVSNTTTKNYTPRSANEFETLIETSYACVYKCKVAGTYKLKINSQVSIMAPSQD